MGKILKLLEGKGVMTPNQYITDKVYYERDIEIIENKFMLKSTHNKIVKKLKIKGVR